MMINIQRQPSIQPRMPPQRRVRDRARKVCIRCHDDRKRPSWGTAVVIAYEIACNASRSLPNHGPNAGRQHASLPNEPWPATLAQETDGSCLNDREHSRTCAASNQKLHGYIGDQSVLSCASEPTVLPPKALREVLVEFYRKNLFVLVPVIDQRDIALLDSSLLLQQAVYFAGSLTCHIPDSTPFSPEDIYCRIKTLLFLNHEKDPYVTLKALCLVGCWNSDAPQLVSFSGFIMAMVWYGDQACITTGAT
ncbi:hypothetical protein P175DRAFT_0556575 [Aspergillus ochraceoroseus IBT 24754]|uniref:Transcription factor domain-containing protein n=1 Tax=Aspergillus ochraceoroseus IBT 24754 TaxID=1392256 RepID=A0A2T5LZ99_9EURO|nr:uncharacterized protein P175DRAFT_0556575 [Aspergillus ochraceoroseus IBT 24754]PTU21609.1 hypothetical protein P175DRAFT_0556575 [Aspergillus ochraceoroseus IBT 24754]